MLDPEFVLDPRYTTSHSRIVCIPKARCGKRSHREVRERRYLCCAAHIFMRPIDARVLFAMTGLKVFTFSLY